MTSHFSNLVKGAIEAEMPKPDSVLLSRENASGVLDDEVVDERFKPLETTLEEELEEGGDEAMKALREKQRALIDALPLEQYEIEGGAPGWADAEKQVLDAAKKGLKTNVVSVKSSKSKRKAGETAAEIYEQELGEKVHKRAKNGSKRG